VPALGASLGITVTLDHEKGKRVDGTACTITFPPGSIPGLEELLRRWESLYDADGKCSDGRCYCTLLSTANEHVFRLLVQLLTHGLASA